MHVIQRGNNRQATFSADEDYRFYLECLGDAAPYALSRMMQHVGRRFVQYINVTYRRSGTLWEGRFKSSLVDAEAYYLRCCRYIDCNPVRAGMVADPADYRWSNHRRLAFGERDPLLSGHEQYLRLGATPAERQRAYRALFVADIDPADLEEIRNNTQRGWQRIKRVSVRYRRSFLRNTDTDPIYPNHSPFVTRSPGSRPRRATNACCRSASRRQGSPGPGPDRWITTRFGRGSAHFNLGPPAKCREGTLERRDLGRVLRVEHAPRLLLVHLHAPGKLRFRNA